MPFDQSEPSTSEVCPTCGKPRAGAPTDQTAQSQPSSDWAAETTREDGGWIITGRWCEHPGEPPCDGPREVIIRLSADAPPDVRQRGIDSDVLRRVERRLDGMTAEVFEIPSVGAYQVMVRQYVERRVSELPDAPQKASAAYYEGLLDIFEDLTGRGDPDPLTVMARVMDLPTGTLKARLRTARRQRRDVAVA